MNKQVTDTQAEMYPAPFAWLGLVAVYMGFLSVGLIFHFVPPVLPVVIADMGISHGQAGLLMSTFALPGILLSLPGGWLVDRYGERLVGGLGVILMGLGTVLLGLAPSFGAVLAARVLSGVGAMVGVVALQRLVIRLFTGRGLGLPIGISGSAVPIGIVVVLNTAGPLAESEGWRVVALGVGGATAVVGIIFVAVVSAITRGRALGREAGQDDAPASDSSGVYRPIWIAGAVWFCANGAMTAFMTFAPDHFQGLGFDVSARGLFTSIPMWTSAALGMVTGWLTDRYGGRPHFMALGMAVMGMSLIVLPTEMAPPSLIGLALGMSLAAVVTPTLSLPGALLPPSHTGRGYGILATCGNLGIFLVPPLAGVSRDVSGGYVWPFVIMGVVALAGVAAADFLRRGKFVPGFSRPVAVVLLALVGLAGCGRQDRYSAVEPGRTVAGEISAGHFVDRMAFLSNAGSFSLAADAWSPTDVVFGDYRGNVIRRQGDLITSLWSPATEQVAGVLCLPENELFVATRGGGFWHWSESVWQELAEISVGGVDLLTQDENGRPLVIAGRANSLHRYQGGVWHEVYADESESVRDVWSDATHGTWFVTSDRRVHQLTEAGVSEGISLPFDDDYGNLMLVGDDSGRMALTTGLSEVWIREDGAWVHFTGAQSVFVDALFWHAGNLYVCDYDDLMRWDGSDWVLQSDNIFDPYVAIVIARPDGPLLVTLDGQVDRFDGTTPTRQSGAVRSVYGLAEYDEQLIAYLSDGALYECVDIAAGRWRQIAKAAPPLNRTGFNALVVDDLDRLIINTKYGLATWNGQELSELVGTPALHLHQMADQEILFATEEAGVGSLRGGRFDWLNPSKSLYTEISGFRRRSSEIIEFLSYRSVYHLSADAGAELLWVTTGWRPWKMLPLSGGRAVILGEGEVRELVDDTVIDITPHRMRSNEVTPVSLHSLHELPDGRLLGWTAGVDEFILREGEQWFFVDALTGISGEVRDHWGESHFLPTRHHGLIMFGENCLVQIDMEGGLR